MRKTPSLEFLIVVTALIVIVVYFHLVPFRYGVAPKFDESFRNPSVNERTLNDKIVALFGIGLTNLQSALTLLPYTYATNDYIFTYSISLNLEAASYSFIPTNRAAQFRLLQLLDNGHDVEACNINRQSSNSYLVSWDTLLTTNGRHDLKIRFYSSLNWEDIIVDGPIRTEIVTNAIRWNPVRGGLELKRAWIVGYLSMPQAGYRIEIYDTNNYLLTDIRGYSTNGVVDASWNLQDRDGRFRRDDELDAKVYIWPWLNINATPKTITTPPLGPYEYRLAR